MVGRLRGDGRAGVCLAAAFALTVTTGPAEARTAQPFAVPAGRLSDALIALSEQADISIAIADPRLDLLHTAGIRGRYEVADALRRVLAGSGYGFVFVDARTVRLVRQAPAPARLSTSPPTPAPRPRPAPPPDGSGPDIVVSATKQRLGLLSYPASISVVEPERAELARAGGKGTGFILGKLPQLSSTNLGPGRNKVFIRGIADSSFNGSSQATISQYLGETRLIYSAPDPDLALYDMARIEVLEGPQGTLYGAGTLGGIIRLVPNAPDLQSWSVDLSAGLRATQDGAPGGDGAVTVNVPLVEGTLALRAVAYETIDGGYIDDAQRGLRDINRNKTSGLRAGLRWQPDTAWTVDLSVLSQDIASRDGQYTLRGEPDLIRRSAIAQPFDNDYRLADLTVRRDWGAVELVSATGFAHHAIRSTFDATPTAIGPAAAPVAFTEDITVRLFSHETRLSGQLGGSGSWLAGIGIVNNDDRIERRLGRPGSPALLAGLSNSTLDLAAFGEAGVPLTGDLVLTAGGRFSYVRQSSEFTGHTAAEGSEPVRTQRRLLPSAALSWKARPGLLVYARFQQGYRPGGLQVTGSSSAPGAERFGADRIGTVEAGLRFGMDNGARLSGSFAASLARWRDVQADLVGLDGLPYVANIGSGRVRNVAFSLAWRPRAFLSFEAAGFLNSSDLSKPSLAFADATDRDLPNIADEGGRFAAKYDRQFSWAQITFDAAIRYVGYSKLAIRAPFAMGQGRYYDVSSGARLGFGKWGVALDIDNLLNTRANTFSLGNPFSVAQGQQQTPMRPRSIRIGVDASF
ncbi:TonB-dependent receptor [Novosphingobium sp. P6W]|uniref:TonB-dependent receptor domain-containing protein n=1 Tax=Novosphingobium sp. P6W TaxID=1609758 RepID=UPI0005C2A87D|nr:TonB-dependent receptor [Novosphingobium sp. P6W]AXB76553.1 TonB-dependent receptor [Novosphingobium sp. P6W]KIS30799.1 TonB-dependent receptor [Novosphingobium sp. P6W]